MLQQMESPFQAVDSENNGGLVDRRDATDTADSPAPLAV